MTTPQPRLSARHKRIIEIDGLAFRDLDGDGALTPYEDWRLSPQERAADLCARLSVAQKAGLVIIGSHYMAGSPWVGPDGGSPSFENGATAMTGRPRADEHGSFLRHEDGYTRVHMLTGAPLPKPRLHAAGSHAAIEERHQRHFIVRDNPSARDLATWANQLQEVAERSEFGIPVLLASNPRNHAGAATVQGVGEASGVFSAWPGELGLAATMDAELVRSFADTARREWRAAGLHKIYGYMADVPSEPRWSRFNGTFGEDPAVVSDLIAAVVRGFQGDELGSESVAVTVKHFPGGGVRSDGHDPHFAWGQDNLYTTPGSLERYQLPPFRAAIDAGVSSVMPYYSKPVNASAPQLPESVREGDAEFEEVAFAYNRPMLTGLLREHLGFEGYVNTDSGVLESMAWGVDELSIPERWGKLLHAGSDLVGDELDPASLVEAIEQGYVDPADLDRAVRSLLAEAFALGLFEDPYVDPEAADAIAADRHARMRADDAQRRSVTVLRNDRGLLPLAGNMLYVEEFVRGRDRGGDSALREALARRFGPESLTDDPAAADVAVLWLRPSFDLFHGDDRPGVALSVDLADRGIDIAAVQAIERSLPTVLVIEFANPWLIGAVEPDADAIVGTFGLGADNLVAVLAGDAPAGGRLPLTVPRAAEVVAGSPSDVPGMFCGDDYPYVDRAGNSYVYGHGVTIG